MSEQSKVTEMASPGFLIGTVNQVLDKTALPVFWLNILVRSASDTYAISKHWHTGETQKSDEFYKQAFMNVLVKWRTFHVLSQHKNQFEIWLRLDNDLSFIDYSVPNSLQNYLRSSWIWICSFIGNAYQISPKPELLHLRAVFEDCVKKIATECITELMSGKKRPDALNHLDENYILRVRLVLTG